MKAAFPKRFMSLRDKNPTHTRSKSADNSHKPRQISTDTFFSYFKSEAAKQAAREEAEKGRFEANVGLVANLVEELRLHNITRDNIRFALLSQYAEGDVGKAVELIRLQQQSFSGVLLPYNPKVEMLGAENRSNVTCYLDALLFAMYARLEAFECMLKNDHLSENQQDLAALLRLWVNMLRSGRLIRTDIDALAKCGWQDARLLVQQDTSEAFAFITETLQLPLLTLQVDLFHQGKGDDDDHKVVYERLLNLAVPPDPEKKGVKLEDCLEDYFNTKVDVHRDSLEEKRAAERAAMSSAVPDAVPLVPFVPQERVTVANTESSESVSGTNTGTGTTGSSVSFSSLSNSTDRRESSADGSDFDTTASPIAMTPAARLAEARGQMAGPSRRWTVLEPYTLTPETPPAPSPADMQWVQPGRKRATSIIQRIVIEDGGYPSNMRSPSASDPAILPHQFKRQGSTMVKAVTIPAWQFFRLIPWHSTSQSEPQNDVEVARQFNKRPVVGICLKRYTMDESGNFLRQNTYIDIPDSLRLPYFMIGENGPSQDGNELSSEYKLVLQSVVCHRGVSLHSGHYISFARVNPKLLTDNRRHDFDPPPDYEEQQWVKFDDLAETRVSYVEDIKEALKDEMPYLLFYQIVPTGDLSPTTTDVNDPPSYNASTNAATTPLPTDRLGASNGGAYFDLSSWGNSSTTGHSVRFSAEIERPVRISLDDDSSTSVLNSYTPRKHAEGYSRRGSSAFASSSGTPAITPEGSRSPVVPPTDEPSTTQRLSRAAARLAGKSTRSRPTSQGGDGRISLTMSRLSGLVWPSKEHLQHSGDALDHSVTMTTVPTIATVPTTSATLEPPPSLAQMYTAPAATLIPGQHHESVSSTESTSQTETAASSQQHLEGHDDHGHHKHHHHHHYTYLRRKDKDTDGAGGHAGVEHHKSKGKEKVKDKSTLPERECLVM